MTFKEYVAKRRITDTPQGDFTNDAQRDKNMPDITTWDELKSYVQRQTSNTDVLDAARHVWQGYTKKHNQLK